MPWVRIDEDFPRHPKIAAVGPLGMALQIAGLCYCNQYLTDGFIPKSVAVTMLDLDGISLNGKKAKPQAASEALIANLVKAGVWDTEAGGYRVHDYHDFQPSRAEVLAERERNREAGRRGGQARAKRAAKRTASEPSSTPPSEVLSEPPNGPLSEAVAQRLAEAQAKSKPVPVPGTEESNGRAREKTAFGVPNSETNTETGSHIQEDGIPW